MFRHRSAGWKSLNRTGKSSQRPLPHNNPQANIKLEFLQATVELHSRGRR